MPPHGKWYLPLQIIAQQVKTAVNTGNFKSIINYSAGRERMQRIINSRVKYVFDHQVYHLHIDPQLRDNDKYSVQLKRGVFDDSVRLALASNEHPNEDILGSASNYFYAIELVFERLTTYEVTAKNELKRITLIKFTPAIDLNKCNEIEQRPNIISSIPHQATLLWRRGQFTKEGSLDSTNPSESGA